MKNKELHKKLVQQKKYKAAFIVNNGFGEYRHRLNMINCYMKNVTINLDYNAFGQVISL